MKLCEHYSHLGDELEFQFLPWNAFVWRGRFAQHFTGLGAEYLEHLKGNPKCRKSVKVTMKEIKKRLAEIEREWRTLMG